MFFDNVLMWDIDITLFSQPTMDASQLGRFINRIDNLKLPDGANIQTSEHSISISFTRRSDLRPRLQLQIYCKQLDWQFVTLRTSVWSDLELSSAKAVLLTLT